MKTLTREANNQARATFNAASRDRNNHAPKAQKTETSHGTTEGAGPLVNGITQGRQSHNANKPETEKNLVVMAWENESFIDDLKKHQIMLTLQQI
jgi:hypothetical protein